MLLCSNQNQFRFFKDVLIKIIDDEYDYRLMIVSPEKDRFVIPYDGRIAIIMESKEKKDIFEEKYREWFSRREDGL